MAKFFNLFPILVASVILLFPDRASALNISDLPGPGETLVIENDDGLVIKEGETAILGGTLSVKGSVDVKPAFSIENSGKLLMDDATITCEYGSVEIKNKSQGIIMNSLDLSQTFIAGEAGRITIDNYGEITFVFLAGGGKTFFEADSENSEISLNNSGTIDIPTGQLKVNCIRDGLFSFSQPAGNFNICNLSASVSGTNPDKNTLVFYLSGGTFNAGDVSYELVKSSLIFSSSAETIIGNAHFVQTGTFKGSKLINNGSLMISNLNVEAYIAGFLLENDSILEISNSYIKSQVDASGVYPSATIENRKKSSFKNLSAIANGLSGIVRLINHDNMFIGNFNINANYGGMVQTCFSGGEASTNNMSINSSGYSHGSPSKAELTISEGTFYSNNVSMNVTNAFVTVLNMADVSINNLFIKALGKAVARMGSLEGEMVITNFNVELKGDTENVSGLNIWSKAVLSLENINARCGDEVPFEIPILENGTIYSFRSDCSSSTSALAAGPANPSPVSGSVGIDPAMIRLSWQGAVSQGGAGTYDLYIFYGKEHSCVICSSATATGLRVESFVPAGLEYGTVYNWLVVYNDAEAGYIASPVWSFTTMNDPSTSSEDDSASAEESDGGGGGCSCFITTAVVFDS